MARQLGKQVRLEIEGLETDVDRDVLEKLEAPLTHLLAMCWIMASRVRTCVRRPENPRPD